MLQSLRNKSQKIFAWVIIALIIVTFAFWGVENFRTKNGVQGIAAQVNGEKISWHQVESLYQDIYNSIARANPRIVQSIDSKMLRDYARQQLVMQAAFKSQTAASGYVVTDQQVMQKIKLDENFHENGKFSVDKYKQLLRQAGQTDSGYENNIRIALIAEQAQFGLAESSFALPREVDRVMALWTQTRDFGYTVISTAQFGKNIAIDPSQVEKYYQQHQQLFVTPEQVKIAYVILSLEDYSKSLTVTDELLQKYYQEHQALYTDPEGVQVRHIFVSAPEGSSQLASGEAKAKIDDLLAKVKLGSDFASLAKQYSEDPGSAPNGGDLGFQGHGETVPEFETAAFNLQKSGDISEVVQTRFGFHIIQLIKRQNAQLRPFAEVRNAVMDSYRQELAEASFYEKGEELASLAFEHPESLEKAAEVLELQIKHSDYFTRNGGTGIAAESMVREAAFSQELMAQNRNSDLLKIDEEHFIVLRVTDHNKPAPQTLAEVREKIAAKLIQQEAERRAAELGKEILTGLNAGEAPFKLTKQHALEWVVNTEVGRNSDKINQEILQRVFNLPKPAKPQAEPIVIDATSATNVPQVPANTNVAFTLANGDYVVLSLSKVSSETADKVGEEVFKIKKQRLQEQVAQQISKTELQLYQQALISRAEIKMEDAPY